MLNAAQRRNKHPIHSRDDPVDDLHPTGKGRTAGRRRARPPALRELRSR
jgi:hypothetical protein